MERDAPTDPEAFAGLRDMRAWFEQLRRTVAEGQALLEAVAPQMEAFAGRIAEMEEIASRLGELEAMVDRWKGLKGLTTRVA
jgi:type II secretory pathway component PulF